MDAENGIVGFCFLCKEYKEDSILTCIEAEMPATLNALVETRESSDREETGYWCSECCKSFSNHKAASQHFERIHGPDKFICDVCPKTFKSRAQLRNHQKALHTSGNQLSRVQCDICHKWLKNADSLRKHVYRHQTSGDPHICDVCGKSAPNSVALQSHKMFAHRKTRSFECTICNKAFKRAFTLREHMTIHSGNVLYSCPHCPKTFNSSANKHAHKKKVHPTEWQRSRKEYESKFLRERPESATTIYSVCDNAMRPRKPFLLLGVLVIWVLMTYLAFMRTTRLSEPWRDNRLMEKVEHFEENVKSFTNNRETLYRDIISILRKQYEHRPSEVQPLKPLITETTARPAFQRPDVLQPISVAKDGQTIDAAAPALPPDTDGQPDADKVLSKFQQRYINNDPAFPVIPVIVFACNRISVNKCLDDLIRYRPSPEQFPIIVSQDCDDEPTRNTILSYKDEVTLIQQPDQSDIPVPPKEKKYKGYYKISRHYGWALRTVFRQGFDSVIIVEDDLSIAPDFYEYFLGTYPVLKRDRSLWCVSAWNDNGKEGLIDTAAHDLLYRSDFFPGLGWMLTKDLWDELEPKWPKAFWDDWIRQPEQRKERACIRPELPRTRTFGKVGVSNGLFFDKHLKYIKLSEEFVSFTKSNLTYLVKSIYDEAFLKTIYQSPVVTLDELKRGIVMTREPVRIAYHTKEQYKRATKSLGLMDDFKSGVPRTAYRGVVSFFYNGQRVYLAPNANWKGYDLTWS
ncbi:alpha-1,3-mannosyl-glycoprotein beta-1, 2-n-acetylglucosaminyltransferase [Anopheles darlingi]|uniref:alpha-1,3-mannosyl-glycoprotein 2-beta-N-acetylglucosaminyltransferase n=1 Tax=Anopheles darlingi TaxID=43151 RepID=W5JTM3_ANODA|nr:alpha-1,3-mannosyl-glycoprotein beta-1, 2-n-acetylglucosaminyltransferase [Anopheles darlingi]